MLAEVVVDIANSEVDRVFDYFADEKTLPGSRVKVNFGGKYLDGFVLKVKEDASASFDLTKIKPISKLIDEKPVITKEQLSLLEFMCDRFFLRKIDVLKLFLPPEMRNGKTKELIVKKVKTVQNELYLKEIEACKKNAKTKIALLEFLLQNPGVHFLSDLNKTFSNSVTKALIEKGLLDEFNEKKERAPEFALDFEAPRVKLTPEQENAVNKICSLNGKTVLLHGVTGSGKTEIYLNVIEKALNGGKTALMLVPEISLTPQIFGRFKSRFGSSVAIIHSGLSMGERFDEWNRIASGEAKIVVGARSAVFAPLENVGVIILDEQHDSSYNSDSNPRFSGAEVATFRSRYNNCPLVLGSATPDIESYFRTKIGEFELISINSRVNDVRLPDIHIVDMCAEIRQGNNGIFSSLLLQKLEECIKQKKQAMVFINRRGFSSFLRCTECGYIPKCSDCDVSLVYHKEDDQLKCHFCGKKFKVITKCPNCGNEHLRHGGVGTERVVSELHEFFPSVPIFRMDNDTVSGKGAHLEILTKFKNATPSILVGTQMIAKGHDFPNVNLVGIVDADLSLHFSDFRSNERTFSLITQVAGRAGRAFGDGNVILQTYTPKHFVYRCAQMHSYTKFFEKEINIREVTKFPPFASILRVLISSQNEDLAKTRTHEVFDKFKKLKEEFKEDFIYLDAMKSPVKKIQNKFRFQVLCRFKNKNKYDIIKKINDLVKTINSKGISIFVEVNPQNLS